MHAVSSMAAFGLLEVSRTQGTHCSHTLLLLAACLVDNKNHCLVDNKNHDDNLFRRITIISA